MADWLAKLTQYCLAAGLVLAGSGLLLSVPWFLVTAVRVLLAREWVPVIYTLRSLARRRVAMLMTFVGLALVVFVMAAMLMVARGLQHTLESTGGDRNVKVVRLNSPTEMNSQLTVEEVKSISAGTWIAQNAAGQPLVGGEMVILVWLPRPGAANPDQGANVAVRGVHRVAFDIHPARAVEGRLFAPGSREVVIGQSLAGRFEGAALGRSIRFGDVDWVVVGIVDHGGTAYDSEVWGDFEVLGGALHTGYSVASLVLQDPSDLPRLNAALSANPQLAEIGAVKESAFWRALSNNYVEFVTLLGGAVGTIFGLAAVLGAMNTMYAQVAARTREIGALRAIGFKRRAILTAVVFESMLLSLAAGVVGVLAASALGRLEFQLTTMEMLSELTYGLHLSPGSALACLAFAVMMGYAGGLLPALRAASIPIVDAVRTD